MEDKASIKGFPKCKQQTYQPETFQGAENFPKFFKVTKHKFDKFLVYFMYSVTACKYFADQRDHCTVGLEWVAGVTCGRETLGTLGQ